MLGLAMAGGSETIFKIQMTKIFVESFNQHCFEH